MISFSIHFLFCNIFISIIIGAMILVKKISRKHLSSYNQYRIWFLLPIILSLPFFSIRPAGLSQLILWLRSAKSILLPTAVSAAPATATHPLPTSDWMNDFSISVTRTSFPAVSYLPFALWACGMLAMIFFMVKSRIRLLEIERSALLLQNQKARKLYKKCAAEMGIKRDIPVYSTAFLKSPIIVGMLRPRIYIPIHLISDYNETDMRYMLLHELQHYKHWDCLINCLMNLAAIVYWFNPVVWCALKQARSDREIACDTFVLQMLDADDYIGYGNTLLNFAQKVSHSPFSLATGIGGSAKQIRKRILNIASYHPPTKRLKIRERILFAIMIALLLESTALIPVLASDTRVPLPADAVVRIEDLSDYFDGVEGSFVLYNSNSDTWDIYNEELATKRFSPDSTYKIYSALFALENQMITPSSSALKWDGQQYPFPEWNQDQTLASAMYHSVNWYFQELDRQADFDALKDFYQKIDYGNHDLSGGLPEFWMESSLKISALEQVELLKKLYTNEFHFDNANVQAVKDSLTLSVSGQAVLSGKTGTGVVNGKNINGWLIGYVETISNTWFFATNIQGSDHADSTRASEITLSILSDKGIYG